VNFADTVLEILARLFGGFDGDGEHGWVALWEVSVDVTAAKDSIHDNLITSGFKAEAKISDPDSIESLEALQLLDACEFIDAV
jgi:hypothetical protein